MAYSCRLFPSRVCTMLQVGPNTKASDLWFFPVLVPYDIHSETPDRRGGAYVISAHLCLRPLPLLVLVALTESVCVTVAAQTTFPSKPTCRTWRM